MDFWGLAITIASGKGEDACGGRAKGGEGWEREKWEEECRDSKVGEYRGAWRGAG